MFHQANDAELAVGDLDHFAERVFFAEDLAHDGAAKDGKAAMGVDVFFGEEASLIDA